jgi:hypothetical protein
MLSKLFFDRRYIDAHALLVHLLDVQRVDVRLEDVFYRPLPRIDADLVALEDTSNLYTITGFADIDELIVGAERDGMWRLTIRHVIWGFLQLDDLLVGEAGTVMDDLHRIGRIADGTRALGGLGDLATVNVHPDTMIAHRAAEEGWSG